MNLKQMYIGHYEVASQYHTHTVFQHLMERGHIVSVYSDDKVVFFVIDQLYTTFQEMLVEKGFKIKRLAVWSKVHPQVHDLPSFLKANFPNHYAIYDKDVLREYLFSNYDSTDLKG